MSIGNGSRPLLVVSTRTTLGTIEIDGEVYDVRAPRLRDMPAVQAAQERAGRDDATPEDRLGAITALLAAAIPGLGRERILDLEPDVAAAIASAVVPLLDSRAQERETELRACPTLAVS